MKVYPFLIIIALCMAGTFLSCTKDKQTYTISGRVLQDCSSAPYANKELSFSQSISTGITSTTGGTLGSTITDANGHFTFKYIPKNDLEIKMLSPGPTGFGTLMGRIPAAKSLSDILIYTMPVCNMKVNMNGVNPHILGDTLYILDLRNGQTLQIPCPLANAHLYTASNVALPAMGYGGSAVEMRWYFKSNPSPIRYQSLPISKYCNDTVSVTIDIN